MKIPQLKRKLEVKKYHNFELKDEFSVGSSRRYLKCSER